MRSKAADLLLVLFMLEIPMLAEAALPPGPPGVEAVLIEKRSPDGRAGFLLSIENKSDKAYTFVEPLDGSTYGWLYPIYETEIWDLSGKKLEKSGRCGMFGGGYTTENTKRIAPGEKFVVPIYPPYDVSGGYYRLRASYCFSRDQKGMRNGRLSADKEAEKLLKDAFIGCVVSNELAIDFGGRSHALFLQSSLALVVPTLLSDLEALTYFSGTYFQGYETWLSTLVELAKERALPSELKDHILRSLGAYRDRSRGEHVRKLFEQAIADVERSAGKKTIESVDTNRAKKDLESADAYRRKLAVEALAEVKDTDAILSALKDDNREVVLSAVYFAGELRLKQAKVPLVEILQKTKEPILVKETVRALVKLSDESVAPHIAAKLSKYEEEYLRFELVRALRELKSRDYADAVFDATVQKWSEPLEAVAAEVLSASQNVKAVARAVKEIDPNRNHFRLDVLERTKDWKSEEIAEAALLRLAHDSYSDAAYRKRVIDAALLSLSADARAALLKKLAQSEDPRVKREALEQLKATGDASVYTTFLERVDKQVGEDGGEIDYEIETFFVQPKNHEWLLEVVEERAHPKLVPALKMLAVVQSRFLEKKGSASKDEVFQEAIAACRKLMDSNDPNVRLFAARALGFSKDSDSVELLLGHAQDAHELVRKNVLFALQLIGDPRAMNAFVQGAKDSSWRVRVHAARGLGKMKQAGAKELLLSLTSDADEWVRSSAVIALGGHGAKDVVDRLAEVLRSEPVANVRRAAVKSLEEIKGAVAIEALITSLEKDRDGDVRALSAQALGELVAKEAFESLIAALGDGEANVRYAAALALSRLGDARAIPKLKALLKDSDEGVSYAAERALEALGGK